MKIKNGKHQELFNKLGLGPYCNCRLQMAIELAKEKFTQKEINEYFDTN